MPASLSINFTAKSNRKMSEGSVSPKVTNSLKLLVSPQRGAGEIHAAAEHKEEEDMEDEEQEIEVGRTYIIL